MQDVPKIVRERLKAARPAAHHPDADMLTAFAERSLPERDRAVVLEHLGRCGDCRDVLALAMPDAEAIGAPSPARGPWLTWPAIRFAFVAAGIVAVAAIGVMKYQKREPVTAALQVTRTQDNAPQASAPQASATEAKNEAAPPAVSAPPVREEKARKDFDGYIGPAPATTPGQGIGAGAGVRGSTGASVEVPAVNTPQAFHGAVGGVAGRLPSGGPKAPVQWQQNNTNTFQNQAAPAPPAPVSIAKQAADSSLSLKSSTASQTVEVAGAAPAVNTLDANQAQSQPIAPKATDDNAVGKAKAPVTVEAEAATMQNATDAAAPQELPMERSSSGVVGRNFTQLVQAEPMIRWTVTSAGGLQRSFDRGNTWQDVNVNAVMAGGSMSYAVAAKTSRSKEKLADKADKKVASPTVVFRAVAAIGPEVWAGGTGGALYHSSDSGNQWTRVMPSAGGTALTGDIVGVEFADAQNGKITTSTGEVWSTADTGQTWQKH